MDRYRYLYCKSYTLIENVEIAPSSPEQFRLYVLCVEISMKRGRNSQRVGVIQTGIGCALHDCPSKRPGEWSEWVDGREIIDEGGLPDHGARSYGLV